jgi:hypothetical protein
MFAERFLSSHGVVELAGRKVKVYHLNVEDRPIEPHVVAAALGAMPKLLAAPDATTPAAAFAIVHRGRGGAAYALAYSWVWDNVIEAHTAAAGVPFLGCPDEDPTHFVPLTNQWIGCVWELGPFEHERSAWVQHMLSGDASVTAYLADTCAPGPVGGVRTATR